MMERNRVEVALGIAIGVVTLCALISQYYPKVWIKGLEGASLGIGAVGTQMRKAAYHLNQAAYKASI